MSRERNKTHKKNRRKKLNDFYNTKATFVAGVIILIMCLNDIIELFTEIPMVVNLLEGGIVLVMFGCALGGKKVDFLLKKDGVEKVGAFLTVMGIVLFIWEKTIIELASKCSLEYNLLNTKMMVILLMIVYFIEIIVGAVYLLIGKG